MKVRIKFGKHGYMKFVGHLDIMRFFQKANRRACIDICYSEGFSPHQKMSFASPLGVGLQSTAEYVDMEVNSTFNSKEAVKRLNDVMVEGLDIYSYRLLPDDAENAMSVVSAADYLITFKNSDIFKDNEFLNKKISEFLSSDTINVLKKSKKSEKITNIRSLIYDLKLISDIKDIICDTDYSSYGISMSVASGSVNNLKPELVMEAFFDYSGIEFNVNMLNIYRTEIYANLGTEDEYKFIPLNELGTEII